VSAQTLLAVLVFVEKSIAQTAALIGSGVRRAPFANEAETASSEMWF